MPAATAARVTTSRILHIALDERSILRRNPDIEREREVAIFDLLEENDFALAGHEGPYRIRLGVEENRLVIDVRDAGDAPLERVQVGLARFKRPVRDYFAICDSYFRAVRGDDRKGLEAIDMARRGQHDDAAALLQESLAGKVTMDHPTARRLFTLICVLHIRQPMTAIDSRGPAQASTSA